MGGKLFQYLFGRAAEVEVHLLAGAVVEDEDWSRFPGVEALLGFEDGGSDIAGGDLAGAGEGGEGTVVFHDLGSGLIYPGKYNKTRVKMEGNPSPESGATEL